MDCLRNHESQRTTNAVTYLAESQKSYWRHKCAACGYEKGFEDGRREGRAEAERALRKLAADAS